MKVLRIWSSRKHRLYGLFILCARLKRIELIPNDSSKIVVYEFFEKVEK